METFLAFIRGINVGGKNIIQMSDLKKLFEEAGFEDIKTYIQSGNVIFKSKGHSTSEVESLIEDNIRDTFNAEVKVIVKTIIKLNDILKRNPFFEKDLKDNEKIYITLLSQIPAKEDIKKLEKFSSDIDEFRIIESAVYILCRNGYGKTLFSNKFFEKKLNVLATTRNLETMNRVYNIGKEN